MNTGMSSHNPRAYLAFYTSRPTDLTKFIIRPERHHTLGCLENPLLLIGLEIDLLQKPLNKWFHKVLHVASLLLIIRSVVHHHDRNRKEPFILANRLKTELFIHVDVLLLIGKHIEKDPLGVFRLRVKVRQSHKPEWDDAPPFFLQHCKPVDLNAPQVFCEQPKVKVLLYG